MSGAFGPYFAGPGPGRYADPFRVRRKLNQLLGGPSGAAQVVKLWESPLPEEALPAAELLLGAIREAFDLPAFDPATGQGVGEEDLVALWAAWNEWCRDQKKTAATSPTGSTPSPGPDPPPASAPREPPWLAAQRTRRPTAPAAPSAPSSTPAA